jgi:hypothetical protein
VLLRVGSSLPRIPLEHLFSIYGSRGGAPRCATHIREALDAVALNLRWTARASLSVPP